MIICLSCAYLTHVFCTNPYIFSVQVKPSKRTKKSKPAEEPVFAEPELRTTAPDTSAHELPPEPAHDTPTFTTDPSVEQAMEGSENPENPSPAKADDPDVEITRTDFVEPGSLPCWLSAPPRKNFWNAAKPSWISLIMLI